MWKCLLKSKKSLSTDLNTKESIEETLPTNKNITVLGNKFDVDDDCDYSNFDPDDDYYYGNGDYE
jgi:predicted RND superfamily exporter protein